MSVTLTIYSLHLKKDNLGGVTLFRTMNLDIRLSRFIVLSEVKSLSRLFFFLDGWSMRLSQKSRVRGCGGGED